MAFKIKIKKIKTCACPILRTSCCVQDNWRTEEAYFGDTKADHIYIS